MDDTRIEAYRKASSVLENITDHFCGRVRILRIFVVRSNERDVGCQLAQYSSTRIWLMMLSKTGGMLLHCQNLCLPNVIPVLAKRRR